MALVRALDRFLMEADEGIRVHGEIRHDTGAGYSSRNYGRGRSHGMATIVSDRLSRQVCRPGRGGQAIQPRDITELERVKFVMKGGHVFKNELK